MTSNIHLTCPRDRPLLVTDKTKDDCLHWTYPTQFICLQISTPSSAKRKASAKMVNKILFWSGFGMPGYVSSCMRAHADQLLGLAVRFWQLGIEMRPFFNQLWAYPIYGAIGASFGYYLQGVENGQMRYLRETRDRLLDKRRRRAEREGTIGTVQVGNIGTTYQRNQEGLFASPKVVVGGDESVPQGTVERTSAAQ